VVVISSCLNYPTKNYNLLIDKMNKLLQLLVDTGDVSHRALPGLQKAQVGGTSLFQAPAPIYDNIPSLGAVRKNIMMQQQAAQQAANRAAQERQGSISKAEAPRSASSKAWAMATHPMTAAQYVIAGRGIPEHFDRGPENNLDNAMDVINPFFYANEAGQAISGAGKYAMDPYHNNPAMLGEAALHGITSVPLFTEFAPELKGLTKNTGKNLRQFLGYATQGVPFESTIPRLPEGAVKDFRHIQEIAKMKESGANLADRMKYGIKNVPDNHFERIFEMPKSEAQTYLDKGFGQNPEPKNYSVLPNRSFASDPIDFDPRQGTIDDVRQLILQGYITHHPETGNMLLANDVHHLTNSQLDNALNDLSAAHDRHYDQIMRGHQMPAESPREVYSLEGSDADIDRDFMDYTTMPSDNFVSNARNTGRFNFNLDKNPRAGMNMKQQAMYELGDAAKTGVSRLKDMLIDASQNYPYYSGNNVAHKVPSLFKADNTLKGLANTVTSQVNEGLKSGDVFTGSENTSHNSWLPQVKQVFNYKEGAPQFLGYKPMNQLGYLNKMGVENEDIAKYLNSEIDLLQGRNKIPNDIQRPFMKGDRVMLPQYGVKQFQVGGPIVDPLGQWAHPGQITRIPSNQITMQGVPYPVLGVGSNGQHQMMYPGGEYSFGGAQHVDEYPMMAGGGITHAGHHFPGYNRPIADSDGVHKKVVLAKVGNKTKVVHFGAKGYSNNYSAKARVAYKSRHAGEGSQSKLTAGYWAYHNLWSSHSPANHAGKHSGHGERFAQDGGEMNMYQDGGGYNDNQIYNSVPKRVTFLRHGITDEDLRGENSGQNDIPINNKGVYETLKTAHQLADRPVDYLVNSPVPRAAQTTAILADELSLPHVVNPYLAAWNLGKFSGRPEKEFNEKYFVKNPDVPVPGGESFNNFKERVLTGLDQLDGMPGNPAVVTHSKTLQLLEALQANKGVWNKKAEQKYLSTKTKEDKQLYEFDTNLAKIGGNLEYGGLFKAAFGGPTPAKAREILHDKTVNGHPITDKQRRFFGWISSQKK